MEVVYTKIILSTPVYICGESDWETEDPLPEPVKKAVFKRVYDNLDEAIAAVPIYGESAYMGRGRSGLRVQVTAEVALAILNHPQNSRNGIITTSDEAYDRLGCGRYQYGVIGTTISGQLDMILLCDKEVYPPVFRIGEC